MGVFQRASKWVVVGAATVLLGLGVQSAWKHIGQWISPPPPPVPQQIDSLIHQAAQAHLILDTQTTVRLHPGGDFSYVFVFRPDVKPTVFPQQSWQLWVFDSVHHRLKRRYRLQPIAYDHVPSATLDGKRVPATTYRGGFSISLLQPQNAEGGGQELVVALERFAADATPTVPVIVKWDAASNSYRSLSIFSGAGRPRLHGDGDWQRLYRAPTTLINFAAPQESFPNTSWAEAVKIEPGLEPRLVGLFYAKAQARATPKLLEINAWSLKALGPPCEYDGQRGPRPMYVRPTGFLGFDQLLDKAWFRFRSHVYCG